MRRWSAFVFAGTIVGSLLLSGTPAASGGPTTRLASVTSGGVPVAGTDQTVISGNGRYVAFNANSNELPGTENVTDVYVRDVQMERTRLVSKTSGGVPADEGGRDPSMAGTGLIAFESTSANLPGGDGTTERSYVHNLETGKTTLVSRTSADAPTEGRNVSISRNGRFVVFTTDDPALPGDDGVTHAYVRDRQTGTTKLVSKTSQGEPVQANDPALSADGSEVVFGSDDPDLPGGDGATTQMYVRDLDQGTTELVSRTTAGVPSESSCTWPAISGNGRFAAFYCQAENLPGGDGMTSQVYVHDRQSDQTEIVSVNTAGDPADDDAYDPSLSGSGRYVTFYSAATNLPGNTDEFDAFRHDRDTDRTIVVSRNSAGEVSDGYADSFDTSMSADGRWVAFRAEGTNMPGPNTQSYIRGPLG